MFKEYRVLHQIMQGSTTSHPDWTERYRPTVEEELVGNEEARSEIKKWIKEWDNKVPKKRSLLLVGPPGVGKTTIARAIALENNWGIVELNASEERNAAAIRKAATSGAVNKSIFSFEEENKRCLILLDEVDHMSGKLAEISEKRIKDNLLSNTNPNEKLKGDSGGKAELLKLLQKTHEPVILACNDLMKFWGLGKGWKERQSRFTKYLKVIKFKRARNYDLKKIAKKILDSEGYTIDAPALERLVYINKGDIRALIKDLQSCSLESKGNITLLDIDKQISIGGRDHTLEIFPGLEKLYKAKSAKIAQTIIRDLDKSPDELIAWITWNNPSIHTSNNIISSAAKYLSYADSVLPIMYENLAYRSWYWSSNISALSAGVIGNINPERRLFLNYPNFLRRSYDGWKKNDLIRKISEGLNVNNNSVKNDLYPILQAFYNSEIIDDWSEDFKISNRYNFDSSEHVLISNLNPNNASTKKIITKYEEKLLINEISEKIPDNNKNEDVPDGQTTLF